MQPTGGLVVTLQFAVYPPNPNDPAYSPDPNVPLLDSGMLNVLLRQLLELGIVQVNIPGFPVRRMHTWKNRICCTLYLSAAFLRHRHAKLFVYLTILLLYAVSLNRCDWSRFCYLSNASAVSAGLQPNTLYTFGGGPTTILTDGGVNGVYVCPPPANCIRVTQQLDCRCFRVAICVPCSHSFGNASKDTFSYPHR